MFKNGYVRIVGFTSILSNTIQMSAYEEHRRIVDPIKHRKVEGQLLRYLYDC